MGGVLAVTQPYSVGLGIQEPFNGATPAAGANFTYTVDGYGVRRFLSLVFTVTLANAGSNRYVSVEYRGKDALPFSVNAPARVQTINTADRYAGSIAYHVSDFATGSDVFFPLDPVMLYPGDTLSIIIASINASDAITGVRGVVERFPLDAANLPVQQSG